MSDLNCTVDGRRPVVRKSPHSGGIDYVEVSGNGLTLEVFFLGRAPASLTTANVQISGGRRIRNIRATNVRIHRQTDLTLDDWLEVTVDQTGDFSDYTLKLVELDAHGDPSHKHLAGLDPLYSSATFNFKAGCPSDLDCKPAQSCPSPTRTQPPINYLAKDYGSFRQLILDRLALTIPDWSETHVPDIGIMLVELLAYTGDYLSYYQDAVATEAYLGTARQRISVRRHARLIDYRMHEGCNARAYVTIATDQDSFPLQPEDVFFTTALPGRQGQRIFQPGDLRLLTTGSYQVFEVLQPSGTQTITLRKAHSEIHFYTWGDTECCLAKGAKSATLTDTWVKLPAGATPDPSSAAPPGFARALDLAVGDVLIFEEVIGPGTGNPADADPAHRQAVKLTKVKPRVDPLLLQPGTDFQQPVVHIEWCYSDALEFAVCISTRLPAPDCTIITNVTVARGNVVLVDEGSDTSEPLGTVCAGSTSGNCACQCEPPSVQTTPAPFCPVLTQQPLTFSVPLPPCGCTGDFLEQDPQAAQPQISLTGTETTPQGDLTRTWTPVLDLLDSGPGDNVFVVETDNDGYAHLRFGNGDLGRAPNAATTFTASYRIGNGSGGNVGAEAINCIVFRKLTGNPGNLAPRNPLPASGGTDPEPIEEVKMFAPGGIKATIERAITAGDYATLAANNARRMAERADLERSALAAVTAKSSPPGDRTSEEEEAGDEPFIGPEICSAPFQALQGAKARLCWTGSWTEVLVATDPLGTEDVNAETLLEIDSYLEPYRRIGHDLLVRAAQYVGVDVGLDICVDPAYLRGHVEAALLDILSNRVLADGSLGLFYPDNLTFGEGIYASRIIAAAQQVEGVRSVTLTRLERFELGEPRPGVENASEEVPAGSVLTMGSFEIARVDNDPNYPENGRLTLVMRGGR